MNSHDPLVSQKTVKSGDGTGIAALSKFSPENDEGGMRISAAHITDELDLGIGMFVWMGMRTPGAVSEGVV